MANDILNMKRFGKYLASDLRACVSNFAITFAVAAAAPVALYFFYGIFHLIITGFWGGIPLVARVPLFGLILILFLIALPVSCYGRLTDKRAGSQFLLLPVSSFEKTASMILICCIIAPALFIACYGLLDALICLCDSSCGAALLSFSYIKDVSGLITAEADIPAEYLDSFLAVANPAQYIDDFISIGLIFLLGALCFKKGKVAKTMLALVLISIVVSMAFSPLTISFANRIANADDPRIIFEKFGWVLRNLALVDTISDTVVNLLLSALIFVRVRTLKH